MQTIFGDGAFHVTVSVIGKGSGRTAGRVDFSQSAGLRIIFVSDITRAGGRGAVPDDNMMLLVIFHAFDNAAIARHGHDISSLVQANCRFLTERVHDSYSNALFVLEVAADEVFAVRKSCRTPHGVVTVLSHA